MGVLNTSLSGIQVFRSIYNEKDEIVDFEWILVNDAILRTWGKKREDVIGKTMLSLFPGVKKEGIFELYVRAAKGETLSFKQYYNHEGLDHWFNLNAINFRNGFILSSEDITKEVQGEEALRKTNSELEEKVKQRTAQLEKQRDQVYSVLMQAPAMIAIVRGKDRVFELANPLYLKAVGKTNEIIGKPLLEAMPELKGQPILDILDNVYKTGERFIGNEILVPIDTNNDGIPEDKYFNFVYEPFRNAEGEIEGILAHAVDVTGQVLDRKKIEANEKRLQLAQQAGNIGTFEWDLTTDHIDFTSQVEVIFGYKPGEWEGNYENAMRLVHPEDRERILAENREAIEQRKSLNITHRIIRADQSIGWVNSKAELIFNEDGTPVRMIGVIIDITERQQAEEALKRFKFMCDTANDAFILMREDGTFAYLNELALERWGYTAEEAKHIRVPDVDPVYNDKVFAEVFERAQKEKIPPFETIHKRKDGYIYPVEVRMGGLILEGEPHLFAIARDITERKQYEQTLRESEERFHNLADTTPIYMAMADETGNAVYFNKPWLEWTGRTMDEMRGLGWLCTLHPEDAPKFERDFKSAFEKQIPIREEYRFRRADGEYRWMLAVGAPRITPDGRFVGYFGTYTDFHELKQAQEELKRAQRDTKLLMQKKDEFMAVASHELKTPITTVKASLQLLGRLTADNANPIIKTYLGKAINQVSKLSRLVSDLLDVSKIHAGKMLFSLQEFSMADIIEDCITFSKAESKHEIVVKGDLDIKIRADKHRLEQAICNLLSNAVKYSPGADKVILEVTQVKDKLKVSITDMGIGIEKEKIAFVFDRFFRVSESSMKFSGLGLGLYITREIIKRHGGEVYVESEVGKGSTFHIVIPLDATEYIAADEGNMHRRS